jgi:hypothetical protein
MPNTEQALKPNFSSGAPPEEARESPASLAVLLKTLTVILLFGITHHFHLHSPPQIQVAGVLAGSLLPDAIEGVAKRLNLWRRHVAALDAVIPLWDSIDKEIYEGLRHLLPCSTTKRLTNIGSKLNGMPVLKIVVTSAGALPAAGPAPVGPLSVLQRQSRCGRGHQCDLRRHVRRGGQAHHRLFPDQVAPPARCCPGRVATTTPATTPAGSGARPACRDALQLGGDGDHHRSETTP